MTDRDPRTHMIIGAAMAVHRELGPGFLEVVYQEALAIELSQRNVPFAREVALPIFYKGIQLHSSYRADFICYDALVVELKAFLSTGVIEEAQLIHYLKATHIKVGLLLNFGSKSLEFRRFVLERVGQSA